MTTIRATILAGARYSAPHALPPRCDHCRHGQHHYNGDAEHEQRLCTLHATHVRADGACKFWSGRQ